MSKLHITLDGVTIVKADIEVSALAKVVADTLSGKTAAPVPLSKPISVAQAREMLARINESSARFLRQIAANDGEITWGEMRSIFGIEAPHDYAPFTNGFGRGITRALRHITKDTSATLITWESDSIIDWNGPDADSGRVFIDGPALEALKEAAHSNTQ